MHVRFRNHTLVPSTVSCGRGFSNDSLVKIPYYTIGSDKNFPGTIIVPLYLDPNLLYLQHRQCWSQVLTSLTSLTTSDHYKSERKTHTISKAMLLSEECKVCKSPSFPGLSNQQSLQTVSYQKLTVRRPGNEASVEIEQNLALTIQNRITVIHYLNTRLSSADGILQYCPNILWTRPKTLFHSGSTPPSPPAINIKRTCLYQNVLL